jgi:uncharacterized protein with HEPN domain
MSKRNKILLLEDMLQSANKIKNYTFELDYDSFVESLETIISEK